MPAPVYAIRQRLVLNSHSLTNESRPDDSKYLPLRVKLTEHTSALSCALSNVFMHRLLIASQILIVPSKLPLAYNFAFDAYFTHVILDVCCCDGIVLT